MATREKAEQSLRPTAKKTLVHIYVGEGCQEESTFRWLFAAARSKIRVQLYHNDLNASWGGKHRRYTDMVPRLIAAEKIISSGEGAFADLYRYLPCGEILALDTISTSSWIYEAIANFTKSEFPCYLGVSGRIYTAGFKFVEDFIFDEDEKAALIAVSDLYGFNVETYPTKLVARKSFHGLLPNGYLVRDGRRWVCETKDPNVREPSQLALALASW